MYLAKKRVFVQFLLILMLCIGSTEIASATYTKTVNATDDAEEWKGTYYTTSFSGWRYLAYKNDSQLAGFRFENIDQVLPVGATVTGVYLNFPDASKKKGDELEITIHGDLTSLSPPDFSSTDISSRTMSTNSITWTPTGETSPNLLSIWTEITSQTGWDSTTPVVFLTEATQKNEKGWYAVHATDDSSDATKPKLIIEYSLGDAEISVDTTSLGPTCFVGYNPAPQSLIVTETTTNADFIGTVTSNVSWMSFTIPNGGFTSTNPLLKGSSATIQINYDTSSLSAGTHSGIITIAGNASNSPRTINVTLLVKAVPVSAACGEIPIYAENQINPAIMVQLDTSGSMRTQMPILASGKNPRTPSLVSIVQEIVNQPNTDSSGNPVGGWESGNSMGFVISGTGKRRAYSFDGQLLAAPKLNISYELSGSAVEKSYTIDSSADDVQAKSGTLKTNEDYLELGRSGEPVALRFNDVDIPNGATILSAEIEFVISSADSTTTNLEIHGIALGSAPTYTDLSQLSSNFTSASASWNNVESWASTMSRIDIAEDVLKEVFLDRAIDWGFATWAGGSCRSTDTPPANDWTNYRIGVHDHDDNHQTQLQDKADDGSPGGCTPLAPTLNAGYEYFKSNRVDGYYNETYTEYDCQPKVLVVITDGIGNSATTLQKIEDNMNNLIAEHVSVVAVGFGLTQANASQLYKIAELAQAAGKSDPDDDIYALHKEDASGTALPYLAQSREDFINAMVSIASTVKNQAFYGSSPAATTSADNGEVLLASTFEPTYWTGDLTATKFDAITGALESSPLWTASDMMPTTINGFIQDSSNTTSGANPYTDSSLATDNFLCKSLGDIINSTPKIVGKPAYWYTFDNYSGFKYNKNVYQRDALAYVGANDGALHAFRLADGVEKWRFYPQSVTAKLNEMGVDPTKDICSTSYCHQFLLDGSPQAADIYNGTLWKTVLVTGLGRGGSSYFALDITYGNDFSATSSTDKQDTPSKFLWDFTDSELGLATSYPEIERVENINRLSTESMGTWALLVGSGLTGNDVTQASKEAYLFGLNVWDKSTIWEDINGNPIYKVKLAPSGSPLLDDAAGPPLAVDLDDDRLNERVYVSNYYGNMYRVIGIEDGETPVVSTFFYSGKTDHSNPILSKPGYAIGEDGDHDGIYDIWLYFGTGKYEEQVDKFSTDQQYFYGLFDPEGSYSDATNPQSAAWTPTDLEPLSTSIVMAYAVDSSNNKVDVNNDGTVDSNDMLPYRTISCTTMVNGECNVGNNSWQLALETGSGASERAFTTPLVVGGIVFFTTFVPDGNPCEGNGKSYLFAVDYESGSFTADAVFDINNDGSYTNEDKQVQLSDGTMVSIGGIYIGEGKPTDPVIHGDVLFVGTSGTPPKPIKVNIPSQRVRLKAWRQLFNN